MVICIETASFDLSGLSLPRGTAGSNPGSSSTESDQAAQAELCPVHHEQGARNRAQSTKVHGRGRPHERDIDPSCAEGSPLSALVCVDGGCLCHRRTVARKRWFCTDCCSARQGGQPICLEYRQHRGTRSHRPRLTEVSFASLYDIIGRTINYMPRSRGRHSTPGGLRQPRDGTHDG
jgi:hypothetical protein